MLLEPSPTSYPKNLNLAPACGLYLADIFYDPADMALPDVEEIIDGLLIQFIIIFDN